MNQGKPEGHNAGILMDVRVGQSLMIGNVKVTVEKKAGQLARLRVVANGSVLIQRGLGEKLTTETRAFA